MKCHLNPCLVFLYSFSAPAFPNLTDNQMQYFNAFSFSALKQQISRRPILRLPIFAFFLLAPAAIAAAPQNAGVTLSAATDVVGTPGNFVDVPLFLQIDGQAVGALSAVIETTNELLSFDSFETGLIVPGARLAIHAPRADSMRLAFADLGGGPITENGVLATIRFKIDETATGGDSAALSFSLATAADSAGNPIAIQTENGVITVSLTVFVAGKVFYCDSTGASDFQKPLSGANAKISVAEESLFEQLTDSLGAFRFDELTPNENYRLEASFSSDTSQNYITPGDAFLAFDMYLNANASGCQALAADVNGDNQITPRDALLIFDQFLNGASNFPVDDWRVFPASFDINAPDAWKNAPASIELENVMISQTEQDFNVVGAGDVDLSFSPDSAAGTSLYKKSVTPSPVVLSIAEHLEKPAMSERVAQVRVHALEADQAIYAFGGVLRYDARALEILEIRPPADLSDKKFFVDVFQKPGFIRFGGFATDAKGADFENAIIEIKYDLKTQEAPATGSHIKIVDGVITLGPTLISKFSGAEIFKTVVAEVKDYSASKQGLPAQFKLHANYPNPFNPETKISYQTPADARINLTVFDALGRSVRALMNETAKPAGRHELIWDGRNQIGEEVASGVYFYRIQIVTEERSFSRTRRMLLIR